MQTFLPYDDFHKSASVIDNQRLGNQCYRECFTLFNGGWKHHPASKMWQGHIRALAEYGFAVSLEMAGRKNKHNKHKWRDEVIRRWIPFWYTAMKETPNTGKPPWLGDQKFHDAHKSNLIRKDPEHYGKLWPDIPDDLEYVWPV